MSILITGLKNVKDYEFFCQVVYDSGFEFNQIISGRMKGVEALSKKYAKKNNIHHTRYSPDTFDFGKPNIRNIKLVSHADMAIIIWNGEYGAEDDIIRRCKAKGIPVHVVVV